MSVKDSKRAREWERKRQRERACDAQKETHREIRRCTYINMYIEKERERNRKEKEGLKK